MAKLTSSFTVFFFILCLSSLVSHCSSRPIKSDAATYEEKHWFHHPWLFAYPPMPRGGYKWTHWPPMPKEKKKHWPFAHSPFPCPWWPKKKPFNKETTTTAPPPLEG